MKDNEFNALLAGFSVGSVSSIAILMVIEGGFSIFSPLCITGGAGILIGGSVLLLFIIVAVLFSVFQVREAEKRRKKEKRNAESQSQEVE